MTSITAKGNPGPKEYFTGNVHVNTVVTQEDQLNSVVAKVSFEPKARTNWHTHPYGQILIVTEGVGYYQEKGKPVQIINVGDVVKIPVDVEHWHGATQNSPMTHIAIIPSDKNGAVWMTAVSDEDYNVLHS